MKKLTLWILVLVAGVVAATGIFYLINIRSAEQQNSAEAQRQAQVEQQTPDTPEVAEDQPLVAGKYVDYDEQALRADTGTKVLFFHASWCPQCRELDASIKSAKLPNNTTIYKVDYDSNQDLRQTYGVTLQTTLVKLDISADPAKAKKYVAYNEPNFEAVKQNLLE